jgi:hypothetical protein
MIHLAHDFWTRRYIVIETHGIASPWEIVAVTPEGPVCVGHWPESESRHGTRVVAWDQVKAWFTYAEAAVRHVDRLNKKPSA